MARTYRKPLPGKWKEDFLFKMVHGLVPIPIGYPCKNGEVWMGVELWGPEIKKFSKRMRHKALRRINKNRLAQEKASSEVLYFRWRNK